MAIKLVRLDISTNRLVEDQDLDFVKDYEYDAAGNLTKDATGKLFAYDAENRQKSFGVNDSNSNGGTYIYDGLGRRVKKTVGSVETIFVYDAFGKLAAEYETNLQQTSATKYLTTDNLGSVRIVTNQSGTVLSRHDYQAFGEEVYAGTANRTSTDKYSSADNIRQQFTGYERDTESGLDYAQARYYNTKHGRFTSVDPLTASATIRNPQTFNRFSYGLNSPYKFTDPLGLLSMYSTSACGQFCSNWDGGPSGGAMSSGGYEACVVECLDFNGGFEIITLNLNIFYNTAQGITQSQAESDLKATISDLQRVFSRINIQFNVKFSGGTLTSDYQIVRAVEGEINVFFYDNTAKGIKSGGGYDPITKQIHMGRVQGSDFALGALAHEVGHVFRHMAMPSLFTSGRKVAGQTKTGQNQVDPDNAPEDSAIDAANATMRSRSLTYGVDWVDDYTTVRERLASRTTAIMGEQAPTYPRNPTPFDLYRYGARKIAAQRR